jgi:hypothetical protein
MPGGSAGTSAAYRVHLAGERAAVCLGRHDQSLEAIGEGDVGVQLKQPLGVAAHDPSSQAARSLSNCTSRRIGNERPVDRDQNPVDAEFHYPAQQCRVKEIAAGRDVEMTAKASRKLNVFAPRERAVDLVRGPIASATRSV